MPNTICLTGPPFSLLANAVYVGRKISGQLSFDPDEDHPILAYEWYLDHILLLNQNQPGFSAVVNCGTHTIGARILTADGWSGIKSQNCQTCRPATAIVINGPASVEEGASASYSVIATFTDQSTADVSAEYSFSCPDGSFDGNVFTAATNNITGDSRSSQITASSSGLQPVQKTILIVDTSVNPPLGVLVVDFFEGDYNTLDVAGVIDNSEVSESNILAYTGHNFVPVTTAANALILASDPVSGQVLTHRFEFNLAKLVNDYPATTAFRFLIRGRADQATDINGAWGAKQPDAVMTMSGSTGSHIPGVIGGTDAGGTHNFTVHAGNGADGSFTEATLPELMEFTYNVADRSVSLNTF